MNVKVPQFWQPLPEGKKRPPKYGEKFNLGDLLLSFVIFCWESTEIFRK